MAHTPTFQLSRPELVKSLRFLSSQATDQRDMMILSYCERLLLTDKYYGRQLMVLAALENGAQSRADLVEVTGFSIATVRRCLVQLQAQLRVEVRIGENRSKLYFVR